LAAKISQMQNIKSWLCALGRKNKPEAEYQKLIRRDLPQKLAIEHEKSKADYALIAAKIS
jgi:hypothetical protein